MPKGRRYAADRATTLGEIKKVLAYCLWSVESNRVRKPDSGYLQNLILFKLTKMNFPLFKILW